MQAANMDEAISRLEARLAKDSKDIEGWIMLGHAVSEEAGMAEMAQWLTSFVTEVPVRLVKAGEPFWAPK